MVGTGFSDRAAPVRDGGSGSAGSPGLQGSTVAGTGSAFGVTSDDPATGVDSRSPAAELLADGAERGDSPGSAGVCDVEAVFEAVFEAAAGAAGAALADPAEV